MCSCACVFLCQFTCYLPSRHVKERRKRLPTSSNQIGHIKGKPWKMMENDGKPWKIMRNHRSNQAIAGSPPGYAELVPRPAPLQVPLEHVCDGYQEQWDNCPGGDGNCGAQLHQSWAPQTLFRDALAFKTRGSTTWQI